MAQNENWKRLGSGELLTEDADQGLGHIVPIWVYNTVFITLLFLTITTVWAATLDVGEGTHLFIALFIAFLKAFCVIAVFMHVMFEKRLITIIVIYPIFILALMILGTTGDALFKKRIIPSNSEVIYQEGKAFGIKDEFLKPNADKN